MELNYGKLSDSDLRSPATVYWLAGEEELLKKEFIQRLRDALPMPPGSFDETVLDARDTNAGAIMNSLLTAPIEQDRKFVLVRSAQRLKPNDQASIAKHLDALPDWVCLVLWQDLETEETDSRKNTPNALMNAVKQHGVLMQFDSLTGATLEKRLIALAKANQKSLNNQTARALMNLVDGVATRAIAELEKVMFYVDMRQEITVHDVEQVVSPSREAKVFALVEAIAEGKTTSALQHLDHLFQSGARPDEVALKTLALIARQYRLIWGARAMLDARYSLQAPEKVPKEWAQKLPKDPHLLNTLQRQAFLRSRLQRQAEQMPRAHLEQAFQTILNTDLALKGMKPGVNPIEVMERLVLKLSMR